MKLLLFTIAFWVMGLLSDTDKATVDQLMFQHLESLHQGDIAAFLAVYAEDYEDVKIEQEGQKDVEVLKEMMQMLVKGEAYQPFQKYALQDLLVPSKKQIISFEEAKGLGFPVEVGSFQMQEGDIAVSYFWNDKGFFRGAITRVFRMIDQEWKIVAGF